MLLHHRIILGIGLLACLTATGCANSSFGKAVQRSIAPDPRLVNKSPLPSQPTATPNSPEGSIAQLPADFPAEIPLYPKATLQSVTQTPETPEAPGTPSTQPIPTPTPTTKTVWTTSDTSSRVQGFYNQRLQAEGWQVSDKPADDLSGTFTANRNALQLTIAIQQDSPPNGTVLTIAYKRGSEGNQSPDINATNVPKPGARNFIGPVMPADTAQQPTPASPTLTPQPTPPDSPSFTDLDQAPQALRSAVKEVADLGVLALQPPTTQANPPQSVATLEPNRVISRRQYARWLVAANNRIHRDRPAQQIRLAVDTAQPAFRDVPRQDPDFAVIQGLAEAGILPSPLSGDAAAVTFRPNTLLTREILLVWKIPLDTRQALPPASLESVKQTWGFQDVNRIDPRALRAILADFQNADQANIRRVFGYTTLLQPKKAVTRAEAAASLWYFGSQGDGFSARDVLQEEPQGG